MQNSVGQIHFQCTFDLKSNSSDPSPWSYLVKTIRKWIAESKNIPEPQESFYKSSWFYSGGELRPDGKSNCLIKTVCEIGNGFEAEPELWALRFEHPCSETERTWRTNIGITRFSSTNFRIAVQTLHYLRPNFFGREPDPPMPTAPKVISMLVGSKYWEAFAGTERLVCGVKPLLVKGGYDFQLRLEDPERNCPIVLISKDFIDGQAKIDAMRLARLLAGSAVVYESESSIVGKELEMLLGRRFSCWNGMIRVYEPPVYLDNSNDAKRHRYISGRQISMTGPDATIEMLVRGIARRAKTHTGNSGIVSIEDIVNIRRERRIEEQKKSIIEMHRQEFTAREAEQRELIDFIEQINRELEEKNNIKDNEICDLGQKLAEAEELIDKLKFGKRDAQERHRNAELKASLLHERASIANSMNELPHSLLEVARLIARIHPERIAFSKQAFKSMEDSEYKDINEAWRCFWAMATVLHPLFFDEKAKVANVEKAFQDAAGKRLAMTEGSMTKNDSKLLKLRKDTYDGKEIDITPHVKFDKDTTRAYFSIFRADKKSLIVVGHVGHLDTYGKKRRKD